MTELKRIIPGVLLCAGLAFPAWFLGNAVPVVGSPVFGILFGMLLTMLAPRLLTTEPCSAGGDSAQPPFRLQDGVKYTSKKVLQYSIILLGFGMNLFHVLAVGSQSLWIIGFTLAAAFLTAYIVGKTIGLEGNVTVLIGVGTAICGGSAIAAAAPAIKAREEEIGQAISTIFLFNIIAVFLFPALGTFLGLSDSGFGLWAGTAINDTSSVVAAATAWSNAVGNDSALTFATIVKLTRTLAIVPITFFLAVHTARLAQASQDRTAGQPFRLAKVFPWFVLGFVATAVINTFVAVPLPTAVFVAGGKFMIVMAMAAIGLNTNLKQLITKSYRPIVLGFCCWLAVAGVSLLIQKLTALW